MWALEAIGVVTLIVFAIIGFVTICALVYKGMNG